ncbi:MAG TPA: ATP-binding protein [Acidothermaceae bacterium]
MSRRRIAPHLPRRTVRRRLTVLYGGVFVVSGAALLTITNLLVRHTTGNFLFIQSSSAGSTTGIIAGGGSGPGAVSAVPRAGGGPDQAQQQAAQLIAQIRHQHTIEMHQLLIQSFVALAIMSVLSIGLGWLVAGRALRPLRTITAAARDISSSNLHERLALSGPDDELKELGDTFDALIARLERSFRSQRQFVANASHELRTPLTLQHALLEAALLDPNETLHGWRATGERALAASQEQERLIAALLTLARSERGLSRHEPFDLALLTASVLSGRQSEAEQRGLRVSGRLETAWTVGDPELAERLIANLIDNALRHNVADGQAEVVTESVGGHAVVSVRNTGPVLAPLEIDRLFEPFQRADVNRTSHNGGLGLGLSIVQAIAAAHDADVSARARPTGGLDVEVRFPVRVHRAAVPPNEESTVSAVAG